MASGVAVGGVHGDVGQPHRPGDGLGGRVGVVVALQRQAEVLGEAPAAGDPGAHAGVVGAEQRALVVDAGDGARRHLQPALVGDGRQDRLAEVVQQPGQVRLGGDGGGPASARATGRSWPPRRCGAAGTAAGSRRPARRRRAGGRCWRRAAARAACPLADAHHRALERVDRLGEEAELPSRSTWAASSGLWATRAAISRTGAPPSSSTCSTPVTTGEGAARRSAASATARARDARRRRRAERRARRPGRWARALRAAVGGAESVTPRPTRARRAATATGSNSLPDAALQVGHGLGHRHRPAVRRPAARWSKASATARIRASSGIASPTQAGGVAPAVEALVVVQHPGRDGRQPAARRACARRSRGGAAAPRSWASLSAARRQTMTSSLTPILPTSWRRPATRTSSTRSGRQAELGGDQRGDAADVLGVVGGGRVAGVDRRRQGRDRGEHRLVVGRRARASSARRISAVSAWKRKVRSPPWARAHSSAARALSIRLSGRPACEGKLATPDREGEAARRAPGASPSVARRRSPTRRASSPSTSGRIAASSSSPTRQPTSIPRRRSRHVARPGPPPPPRPPRARPRPRISARPSSDMIATLRGTPARSARWHSWSRRLVEVARVEEAGGGIDRARARAPPAAGPTW